MSGLIYENDMQWIMGANQGGRSGLAGRYKLVTEYGLPLMTLVQMECGIQLIGCYGRWDLIIGSPVQERFAQGHIYCKPHILISAPHLSQQAKVQ